MSDNIKVDDHFLGAIWIAEDNVFINYGDDIVYNGKTDGSVPMILTAMIDFNNAQASGLLKVNPAPAGTYRYHGCSINTQSETDNQPHYYTGMFKRVA